MTLPNLIVIGSAKSGTTALHRYLKAHPQVFMSEIKELNYFSQENNLARGIDWYARNFERAGDSAVVGETSPQYTVYPWLDVAPRIASVVPDAKLIYLVRHPVERTFSHYQVMVARGEEKFAIEKNIWKRGPKGEPPFYLSVSSYAMQIEAYLEHFPREQLLIVRSEDLKLRRAPTMERILRYLEVDPKAEIETLGEEFNKTSRRLDDKIPRAAWLADERRRRVPGYSLVKILPAGVRARMKEAITRGVRLDIPAGLADEIADYLKEDVIKLARYMEPGWDGWGLIPESERS